MIWDPTPDQEILQNVQSIQATPQGSQPFARALGLANVVDRPLAVAQARTAAALNAQIKLYEPRAQMASISVTATAEGALRPVVRLKP